MRLPAGEIEEVVARRIGAFLADPAELSETLAPHLQSAPEQQRLLRRAGELAAAWSDLAAAEMRRILLLMVRRIEVQREGVELQLQPRGLAALLRDDAAEPTAASPDDSEARLTLTIPAQLRRCGLGMALIVEGPQTHAAKPDPTLVRLIARAQLFREQLVEGGADLGALARQQHLTRSYVTRVLRLGFLAPDMVRAVLDGRQPRELTAQKLIGHSRLPLAWPEQRELLGFSGR